MGPASYTGAQSLYASWNERAISLGKPQLLWIGLRENTGNGDRKADFFDERRRLKAGAWNGVKAIVVYSSNSLIWP